MGDISIGAVGAAIVAGIISLFSLIIAKEQKVSEFRQAWIDELRKNLVSYLVNINAISDILRARKSGDTSDNSALISNYKLLNEASLSIKLRINSKEATAQALLGAMDAFESIASNNSSLIPDKIKTIEKDFLGAAQNLLKFEWVRVKTGEKIFIIMRRSLFAMIATLIALIVYLTIFQQGKSLAKTYKTPNIEMLRWDKM